MQLLTERYNKKIQGVISCYDRVVIHGTLPGFNYAQGMTSFLKTRNIRIFDYPRFAQPLRDDIRKANACRTRGRFAVANITIFTSLIKPWACVIYAFQHGVLFGYNSTITVIHGLLQN